MLTAVKNNMRYFFKNLICNIKKSKQYKVNFILDTIFMFINNGAFLLFWAVVINVSGGNANGIVLNDIMNLWGVPVISYGIAYFFFDGVSDINKHFINGTMDAYLLQPKHPLLAILTSKCRFSACGDLIYGIVMVVISSNFNILQLLFSIIISIFASTLYISLEVTIRSLSVFLGDTENLSQRFVVTLFLNFSTYPEAIYGKALKVLLYTVIPSAYIAFVPIRIVTNFNMFDLSIFIVAITAFGALAIFTFNKAVKHYESGNNMLLRD